MSAFSSLVTGIYWVVFERPETREQDKLRKRLRSSGGPKIAKRIDFVKQAEKLSSVKSLDTALARITGIAGSLQRLIAQADMHITVGSLLLASACLFLAAWLVNRLDHRTSIGSGSPLAPCWRSCRSSSSASRRSSGCRSSRSSFLRRSS